MTLTPGLHEDYDEAAYHADPALSQSQAKTLLDCPARFRWELSHPREDKPHFDIGHAVHAKVLGVGAPIVVVDADSWRTKAAKETADAARAEGRVPLLRADAQTVDAMAEAVMAHPGARAIFEADGTSEVTLRWDDDDVPCRGRIDRLAETVDGMPTVIDLKTSASADPRDFGRSIAKFGYDLQDDWYSTGVEFLTGQRPAFVFVVIEKAAPHFASLGICDDEAKRIGREKRLRALDLYRECSTSDLWPAFGDDIHIYPTPRWAS